ncbi:MAG: NUDIX hydrolase [Myxococcales bacterium]|nr:NUDIX hydrolase [Myxococcales bacterium]MCB9642519.1 NUDIX hydrolase [Myxococcales bacterium]
MSWRRLRQKVLHQNPYWSYVQDDYEASDGRQGEYHYARTPGSVLVVPQLSDGRFVMVRQYRYLWEGWGLEFPGGAYDPAHTPEEMAAVELREETGYCAREWISLGSVSPCVGLLQEKCWIFWARGVEVAGEPTPEESELLEPLLLSAQEITQAACDGHLWSGMSLSAWALFQARATDVIKLSIDE